MINTAAVLSFIGFASDFAELERASWLAGWLAGYNP